MTGPHPIERLRTIRPRSPRGAMLAVSMVAALHLLVGPASVGAQLRPQAGNDISVGSGIGFETYRFASPLAADLDAFTLITIPVGARVPIGSRAALEVRSAFGSARLRDANGAETTLSGLTDTEIAATAAFGAEAVTVSVTALAVLPSGTSQLTADEARIAGVMASEFFPLRMTTWGAGGAAGGSVGMALPTGNGSLGVSVGYMASRDFQPIRDTPTPESFVYRPGDQLQVRVAADQNLGGSGKLSLSFAFQHHQEDALDGANLFRPGNRYQGMASYAFAAGARSSAIVYAGGLHSEQGLALQSVARDQSARTLVLFGGGLRVPTAAGTLLPSVDGRVFRRASGVGQGYLGGIGATLEIDAAPLVLAPSARLRLGEFVARDDLDSRVTGIDLGLTVRLAPFGNRR